MPTTEPRVPQRLRLQPPPQRPPRLPLPPLLRLVRFCLRRRSLRLLFRPPSLRLPQRLPRTVRRTRRYRQLKRLSALARLTLPVQIRLA